MSPPPIIPKSIRPDSDFQGPQVADHHAAPHRQLGRPSAPTPSNQPRNSRTKHVLIACVVLLIVAIAIPWLGVVISLSLIGWGVAAIAKKVAAPLSHFYPALNHPILLGLASVGLGVILFMTALGALALQWETERHDAVRRQAAEAQQQQQQREAAVREARLRTEADATAKQWAAALGLVDTQLAQGHLREAYRLLGAAKKDVPQLGLNPMPPSIAAVLPRHQALEARIAPLHQSLDIYEQLEEQRASIAPLIQSKEWLAAEASVSAAEGLLQQVKAADVKRYLPAGASLEQIQRQLERAGKLIKPKADREHKQQQTREAYATLCGPKPEVSGWDGEVIGIARALKKVAHDPDSIDVENCTEPVLSEKHCWITSCNVRGKNMFGGKILQRRRFSLSKLGIEDLSSD